MKETTTREPFELYAELNGIGCTLLGISNQIQSKDGDRLTDEALAAALFSVKEHIFRISEDWMEYCETLEQKGRQEQDKP